MIRVFSILAILGIVSALYVTSEIIKPAPQAISLQEPAANPYMNAIAASGIIEAKHDNIPVGSPEGGLVDQIFVEVWEQVSKGDPLFQLDTRELVSELEVNEAKVLVAQANLNKLQDQLARLDSIEDKRALSVDELKTKEHEVFVAQAELKSAQAQVNKTKTLIHRLTIRAPIDGVVIQKNIDPGEYLPVDPHEPAVILGNMTALQIRADIDEQNASFVSSGSKATAYPKNNPNLPIPLEFVRIEPFVIPKKSLTGLSNERVDTRVLQVIYKFTPPGSIKLYIGQQVDVFIEREALKSKDAP